MDKDLLPPLTVLDVPSGNEFYRLLKTYVSKREEQQRNLDRAHECTDECIHW